MGELREDIAPVVVIGGGITGLSAAFWLDRKGLPVRLFEASKQIGGVIETSFEDGYLIEHGPSTLQGRTSELIETVEAAGLKDDMVYANELQKNRYIIKNGEPVKLPLGPLSFAGTKLFSVAAKFRLMYEPFVKPSGEEDETVSGFVTRRLGGEFLDYAVAPFVGGIYAGDPDQMSFRNSFPRLYALEEKYGSMIGGVVKRVFDGSKKKVKKARPRLFSFRNGLKELPLALAKNLGQNIKTDHAVTAIEPVDGGEGKRYFNVVYASANGVGSAKASAVVLAVPSEGAAKLLAPISDGEVSALTDVQYAPMTVVCLGYDEAMIQHPLNGFGMLTPPKEPLNFLGSLWTSRFFEGRAPEGKVLLTNFIGGMRHPHLVEKTTNELTKLAHDDLSDVLGISGGPEFVKVIRWKKAIPQYNIGHHNIMRAVREFETAQPGIYVTGAFRDGVAVEDAVGKGIETARKVDEYLTESHAKIGEEINV